MTTQPALTREQWLDAAARRLGTEFFAGRPLPERIRCSCSWPLRSARAIGQCFAPEVAADGATHLIVCPTQDEPVRVLDVLLHELIHASVGVEHRHRAPFARVAREFGLAGKPTATTAEPGSPLHERLTMIADDLGAYPHARLSRTSPAGGPSKPRKRWPVLVSVNDPDYKCKVSPDVYLMGLPRDPWGDEMIVHPDYEGDVPEGDES